MSKISYVTYGGAQPPSDKILPPHEVKRVRDLRSSLSTCARIIRQQVNAQLLKGQMQARLTIEPSMGGAAEWLQAAREVCKEMALLGYVPTDPVYLDASTLELVWYEPTAPEKHNKLGYPA